MFDKIINEFFSQSKLAGMSVAITNSKETIYKNRLFLLCIYKILYVTL